MNMTLLVVSAAVSLALAPRWARADNCDEIRAQIESRIAASGVTNFALQVVDTAASAPGRTVGSCARSARRIVYLAGAAASGAGAAPHPRPLAVMPAGGDAGVITECRDGSAPVSGRCAP